ncbi:hypothetical protein UFOVP1351_36 [uncultured Caudovirales phage]|uniref:Uncharacterized protein n=1 Tax=uncultured Caudovirales phage TaxID=2100421 RepID=A0A6J5S0K7_9CAUD|nr:hypothetical protein UFOVP1351_36 [uncultured Caudovirales phage]
MKKHIGTYVCADCGYSHFMEFDSCPNCESDNVEARIPRMQNEEMSEADISELIAREMGGHEEVA